jgi:hypothetical protein
MKLKYIATSIICASLLLVTVNASEDSDITNKTYGYDEIKTIKDIKPSIKVKTPHVEYIVDAELSYQNPILPVYRADILDSREVATNQKIASIFDFETDVESINKSKDGLSSILTKDKRGRTIEYFNSGAIFYSNGNLVPEKSEDILKSKKLDKKSAKSFYQDIATNFLEENKLFKDGIKFKDVSYATIQKIEQQDVDNLKNGIKPTQKGKVVGVAVHFSYDIDGIPTWGAGSQRTVYFNESGVSGYFDQLRSFSKGDKNSRKLISSVEAVNRYRENKTPKNLLRTTPIVIEKVDIKDVKLVYHLDSVNKSQEEIKPYYLITGTFIGEDFEGVEQEVTFKWLESAQG